MEKQAKKHWRRLEVLLIVLVLSFVPVFFLTQLAPEGQETISAPATVALGVAPILVAWILLELLQFFVALKIPGEREFSSSAKRHFYFFAWVAYVVSALWVLYVAVGDVEWINYFYYQLPPMLQIFLGGLAVLSFLKLTPVIFYKRTRPPR